MYIEQVAGAMGGEGADDDVGFFARSRTANEAPASSRRGAARRARVLLGAPDGAAGADLAAQLRGDGHDIRVVADPLTLVEWLRREATVDVVLWGFDLRDPRSAAWQDELGRVAQRLPVVLFSGGGWLATAGAAMRLGAVGILRRPFDAELLRRVIRAAMRSTDR